MPLDRRPNAVCYPIGLFRGQLGLRLSKAKETFAKVLGSPRVAVSSEGAYNYATPEFDDGKNRVTKYFPIGHPLEKQQRYHWFVAVDAGRGEWELGDEVAGIDDRPESIRFGFLVADPHEGEPAVAERVDKALAEQAAANRQDRIRRMSDDPAYRARYQAAMGFTDDEMDARYPRLEPRPDGSRHATAT